MIDVSNIEQFDNRINIPHNAPGVTKMPASTTNTRFDHSNCKHARTGAEGKKARAACRKLHAKEAAAETKSVSKKPAAPRAKRAVKKATVPAVSTEVDELDDADI